MLCEISEKPQAEFFSATVAWLRLDEAGGLSPAC